MATSTSDALAIETRTEGGSTGARTLRRHGKVPGVLYGHGKPSVPITIDARSLEALLHGGRRHHLLSITVDGGSPDTALVRELQRDPLTRRVIHADLQRVGRSEAITTTVPVIAVGVPAGVREFGGVLDVVSHELEVTGPADKIPEHLEVDVSGLGIRDHVTAADIVLPAGFKMASAPDTIVASVEPPRTQEEGTPAAAPEAGEVPTVAESQAEATT